MKVRIRNLHEGRAEIMRQNARFRSSWAREPGGDLITLTVRVAGATVVSAVIGHCRPSAQINKLWQYNLN